MPPTDSLDPPGSLSGHVLVVDDNAINRRLLQRALTEAGYTSATAEHGQQALDMLGEGDRPAFDVILLDIIMPVMDGYEALRRIKSDPRLKKLPVIMITAVEDVQSVIQCIELGATDYLPKPFHPGVLKARLTASLSEKRLRDLEIEYLQQVGKLIDAATALEESRFEAAELRPVAQRDDALGTMARVFTRMAEEVALREIRLRKQLEQIRLDMLEREHAAAETAEAYIPLDRRLALAEHRELPDCSAGSVMLVDVSGFSAMASSLVQKVGFQRGAEELIRRLNQVFGQLIEPVHNAQGSVISFSGDAMMCWFDGDAGLRSASAGLDMQKRSQDFPHIDEDEGEARIAVKVVIGVGVVRRFVAGDPHIQLFDVIAGDVVDLISGGDRFAAPGQVVMESRSAAACPELVVEDLDGSTGMTSGFVRIAGIISDASEFEPEPAVHPKLDLDVASRWLHPLVFERVSAGKTEFLSELRTTTAVFMSFAGIDWESDQASSDLNAIVSWVQSAFDFNGGVLLQVTTGEKGNFVYGTFGAPLAHEDDPLRALATAFTLLSPPAGIPELGDVRVGIASGQSRAGAYGSPDRRTYGVQGESTNLAARLMQAAQAGILCDREVYRSTREWMSFEEVPGLVLKGFPGAVTAFRPIITDASAMIRQRVDRLAPDVHDTLRAASVIGMTFDQHVLAYLNGAQEDTQAIEKRLVDLESVGLIRSDHRSEGRWSFVTELLHRQVYAQLLFSQRRRLHRRIAEVLSADSDGEDFETLAAIARHREAAEDWKSACENCERLAEMARERGDISAAERYTRASLALERAAR